MCPSVFAVQVLFESGLMLVCTAKCQHMCLRLSAICEPYLCCSYVEDVPGRTAPYQPNGSPRDSEGLDRPLVISLVFPDMAFSPHERDWGKD
eukprot:jgi/Chrzof1/12552/UNPLg00503.t1